MIQIKRVYEPASKTDGFRILIDRIWPRGVSKQKAKINLWSKEIAPSAKLRKWFSHDPQKWPEFQKKYFQELKKQKSALNEIRSLEKKEKVTLVFAAKDEQHNNAVALKNFLKTFK